MPTNRFTPAQRQHLLDWIEMLRSGHFRQTSGQLKSQTANGREYHCCLGVACELYSTEVGGFWDGLSMPMFYADAPADTDPDYSDFTNTAELPDNVLQWLGLKDDEQGTLAGWNDDGLTFTEIANVLEALVLTGQLKQNKQNPVNSP